MVFSVVNILLLPVLSVLRVMVPIGAMGTAFGQKESAF